MDSSTSSEFGAEAAPVESVRSQSRPRARWVLPQAPESTVRRLQRELGVNRLVASVLAERGFSDVEPAREFLSPQLASLLDPLAMRDMERAADRLIAGHRDKAAHPSLWRLRCGRYLFHRGAEEGD